MTDQDLDRAAQDLEAAIAEASDLEPTTGPGPAMLRWATDWRKRLTVWIRDLRGADAPRQVADEALGIKRGSLQDIVGSPYQSDAELVIYAMTNFPHLVSLLECSRYCVNSKRGGGNDPQAPATITLQVTDAIVRSITGPKRSAVCEAFLVVIDQRIHDSADEVQKVPQPLESKAYADQSEPKPDDEASDDGGR